MVRSAWQSLNGPWDYASSGADDTRLPAAFVGKILVPYPFESALSGVRLPSPTNQRLWYHRTFRVPPDWLDRQQRVLLHFGAVNWECSVALNGHELGSHTGGYDAFEFDATESLKPGENDLTVDVRNPLTSDTPDAQILGKQRAHPVSVLYTASTGIWQSVWLEPVPAVHINFVKTISDIDAGVLHIFVNTDGIDTSVEIKLSDGANVIGTVSGKSNADTPLAIPNPHLWSPEDPHLYSLTVRLSAAGTDAVETYTAMRKISLGKDRLGRTCVLLNNKPVFQVGTLDQGYWPDGLYTAPTDEALKYDIVVAKQLGFNLLRKHAKVEPDRWYYWTDKLGMLVWQDMPQAFGDRFTDQTKRQWLTELTRMIATRANHPSIVMWTLFNEGWGQHDTAAITAMATQLDPTRLINSASGGYNQIVDGKMSRFRLPTPPGLGDINDTHTYPEPSTEKQDPTRALVCGEFGGVSLRLRGHLWTQGNFGYGKRVSNGWQLTQRYQDLLKDAYRLRDDGACAVVYTQIADVEEETNGLLTYDRALIKPIAEIVTAANHGNFPTLPAKPIDPAIVPTSEAAPQTWSYTTTQPDDRWSRVHFDAAGWKTGAAPFGKGYTANTDWHTDDIWMQRRVTLPATIPAKLKLLVQHDEDVQVFINGVLAADATGYTGDYAELPVSDAARAAIKPGDNVIAVHCDQTVGGQVVDVGLAEAAE